MVPNEKHQKIFQLILFRKNMGACMPKEKALYFWGKECERLEALEKSLERKKEREEIKKTKERKMKIVKDNLKHILFKDWVKFVGITGSVAADIPSEDDDIDVLVVVKNNRMWLYRAILTLRLGRKSMRRVWGKPFKDKIDTNFICEERGMKFNTESIFVLHELLFMIPVYNRKYYEKILNINHQLLENYGIKKRKKEYPSKEKSKTLAILDKFAFILQYVYMLFKRHKPDYKRLKRNNRKGRIAFFPEEFRKEKERKLKKDLKAQSSDKLSTHL